MGGEVARVADSTGEMPWPTIGEPLPRVEDAWCRPEKWTGWIVATPGHGRDWQRVFRVDLDPWTPIWNAILEAVPGKPVSTVRKEPHGHNCRVLVVLTMNQRTARVATAWHYPTEQAGPKLTTAFPNL